VTCRTTNSNGCCRPCVAPRTTASAVSMRRRRCVSAIASIAFCRRPNVPIACETVGRAGAAEAWRNIASPGHAPCRTAVAWPTAPPQAQPRSTPPYAGADAHLDRVEPIQPGDTSPQALFAWPERPRGFRARSGRHAAPPAEEAAEEAKVRYEAVAGEAPAATLNAANSAWGAQTAGAVRNACRGQLRRYLWCSQ
jgi:hypothetical protein